MAIPLAKRFLRDPPRYLVDIARDKQISYAKTIGIFKKILGQLRKIVRTIERRQAAESPVVRRDWLDANDFRLRCAIEGQRR